MIPIQINGTAFRSLRACWLARENPKPSYSAVSRRLMTGQYSIEECFEVPAKFVPMTVNGVTYRSIAEACKALGVERGKYNRYRIRHGNASLQEFLDKQNADRD